MRAEENGVEGASAESTSAEGPGPGEATPALLAELRDLTAKLAGTDPALDVSLVSDASLMDATEHIERVLDLARVAESRLLARLEATAATDTEVGLRTGEWIGRTSGQSRRRCGGRVRSSAMLWEQFPFLADAVVQGWLSWSQVEVILGATNARNRDDMIAECTEFIRWANGSLRGRFDRWAAKVRRRADELDQDGGYDPNDDVLANRLRLSALSDGTRELAGRLVGEAGVTVTETLEQIADELHAQFREAHNADASVEVPSRATLMALAMAEACKRAQSTPEESNAPKTDAVLVIEADETGHAVVHTGDGDRVPTGAADALLWNAEVRALLVDGEGCPLYLGRRVRLATRDQRTAMNVRDGGCIFPGCERPARWTHAHHEPAWADGGTTDINHLAGLCGRHHGVRHREGWTGAPDPDRAQQWTITTPTGRVLHTERNPRE